MNEIKDKYICTCCGGRIDPTTMRCEYCGTQYKEERGEFIRIETFRSPVQTITARRNVGDELFQNWSASEVAEYVLKDMASELAHLIIPMMEVQTSRNIYKGVDITATVKIVEPAIKRRIV